MFDRAFNRLRSKRPQTDPEHLERCAMCAGDFVNPVDWEPVGETNAIAARFDLELDRRLDIVARALERLDRSRMAAEVETMILALRHGLVDPTDFAH
jgi:hypothetical protein